MNESARVLVVDSNPDDRSLSVVLLTKALGETEIVEAPNAMVFADRLSQGDFAAVVTDYRLDWGDGFQVLDAVRGLHPACPVVFFTSAGSEAVAAEGFRRGLAGYVIKGSAGFLALPAAVKQVIADRTEARGQGAAARNLARLTDELGLGTFGASQGGVVSDANAAFARMFRHRGVQEILGRTLTSLLANRDAQRELAETLGRGGALHGLEAEGRRADGSTIWLRISAWPRAESGGIHYDGVVEDVSDRRRAERELTERATAVDRSSDELQEVAYAISHDLQEPLQLITRYGRLLAKTPTATETERYIGTIMQCAERMQAMINDVLAYARVGTRGQPFAPVDFGDALKKATANLKAAIEESHADVSCERMPTLVADGAQMAQLFQNLISNALKFRRGEPRVKVLAIDEGDEWTFAIADNGIGIAPQHLDRVFGMFQRLHTSHEYPGTGIGLAICKRIVERHGGRIWASSEPGQGSTFCFTLPKRLSLAAPSAVANGQE